MIPAKAPMPEPLRRLVEREQVALMQIVTVQTRALKKATAAASKALLTDVVSKDPTQLRRAALISLQIHAHRLRSDTRTILQASAAAGEEQAVVAVGMELLALDRTARTDLSIATSEREPIDIKADGIVSGWQAAALAAVLRSGRGKDLRKALEIATQAQVSRLDITITDTVVGTYNEQHDSFAQRAKQWLPALLLIKRWDAKLDKACAVCRALDGKLALIGTTFDGAIPGRVHPRCRCTEHLMIMPKERR